MDSAHRLAPSNLRRPSTATDATPPSPLVGDPVRRRSLSDTPQLPTPSGANIQRSLASNGGRTPGEGTGGGPAPVRRTNSSFSAREASPSRASPTPSSQSPLLVRHHSATAASIFGGGRSPFRTSSFSGAASTNGGGTPPMRTGGESYSARTMAAALEGGTGGSQDDVWKELSVRVLPIFNGESLRGFVEDLNELVRSHMRKTIARHTRAKGFDASLISGLLISDLASLIAMGCLTLSSSLSPAPPQPLLSDDEFLERLDRVWQFYWTTVIPSLESVFWVLRTDERLRVRLDLSRDEREKAGLTARGHEIIDVRQLALTGFRDHVLLPQIDAVATLFGILADSPASSFVATPPDGAQARRRQMVSLLASVLTADAYQSEMNNLLSVMRSDKRADSRGGRAGERRADWVREEGGEGDGDVTPRSEDLSQFASVSRGGAPGLERGMSSRTRLEV